MTGVRVGIGAALVALLAAAGAWLWLARGAPEKAAALASEPAQYVGSEKCAQCHAQAAQAWRDSHHALAMQPATADTVLGDFDGAQLRYGEVTSTFRARDGHYFVTTDGPDGAMREYAIGFTFGVTPLQQYLIELDGGRWQALSIAWDTRPEEQGGQRWYHLYPGERVDHGDVLHWTRRSQNWNHMCAECHTTGYAKGYDADRRIYASRYAEAGVGCEACHGPGSRHAAGAERGLRVRLDERRDVSWVRDPATGQPRRSAPRATSTEIEGCARCHARRSQLAEEPPRGQLLLDTHLPALLEAELYEADGQIRGEVYEYGSFVQSRMYREGVTCSDCHEPHSARLRGEGDAVCAQCHEAPRYQARSHHFHDEGSEAARCVSCHMPSR